MLPEFFKGERPDPIKQHDERVFRRLRAMVIVFALILAGLMVAFEVLGVWHR